MVLKKKYIYNPPVCGFGGPIYRNSSFFGIEGSGGNIIKKYPCVCGTYDGSLQNIVEKSRTVENSLINALKH